MTTEANLAHVCIYKMIDNAYKVDSMLQLGTYKKARKHWESVFKTAKDAYYHITKASLKQ